MKYLNPKLYLFPQLYSQVLNAKHVFEKDVKVMSEKFIETLKKPGKHKNTPTVENTSVVEQTITAPEVVTAQATEVATVEDNTIIATEEEQQNTSGKKANKKA